MAPALRPARALRACGRLPCGQGPVPFQLPQVTFVSLGGSPRLGPPQDSSVSLLEVLTEIYQLWARGCPEDRKFKGASTMSFKEPP